MFECINFSIFIYTVDDLYFDSNQLKALANKVLSINIKKEKFIKLEKSNIINLNSFEFILIRQDPPFNMKYITTTYLLERLPKSCIVLNKPNSAIMIGNACHDKYLKKKKRRVCKNINRNLLKKVVNEGEKNINLDLHQINSLDFLVKLGEQLDISPMDITKDMAIIERKQKGGGQGV